MASPTFWKMKITEYSAYRRRNLLLWIEHRVITIAPSRYRYRNIVSSRYSFVVPSHHRHLIVAPMHYHHHHHHHRAITPSLHRHLIIKIAISCHRTTDQKRQSCDDAMVNYMALSGFHREGSLCVFSKHFLEDNVGLHIYTTLYLILKSRVWLNGFVLV